MNGAATLRDGDKSLLEDRLGEVVPKAQFDALKEKLEDAEKRAERAEAKQALANSLGQQLDSLQIEMARYKALSTTLEEKLASTERQLRRARDEISRHDEAAVAELRGSASSQSALKWVQELNVEGLRNVIGSAVSGLSVEGPYQASREGLWATVSLVHWRTSVLAKQESAALAQEVRTLREEKELAEEKLATWQSQRGGAEAETRGSTMGLDGETMLVREKEEARRATEMLRTRTMEVEEARLQCQLAVKEANRLRAELIDTRACHEDADRRLVQAEIEVEIWRERGHKWKAYLAELMK